MRLCKVAIVIAGVLIAPCFGQSLGDIAKQQRDKQAKTANTSRKVVTNEDIPESPDASNEAPTHEDYVPPPTNDKRTAAQWKAAILKQKGAIASLQKNIDQLKGSVHFVDANRYRNGGVQYNQRQIQKQQDEEQMQKQLNALKRGLEEMQETARHLGLGSAVYDP
jgi:hypothetical protein